MSLFGVMRTATSGLNGQSAKMSSIADNIANSSTTGYKKNSVEFSSLVDDVGTNSFTTGGINPRVRYAVAQQGGLIRTSSGTDLAVQGNGFFVVADASGAKLLTRAGAFVPDSSGRLVNSGGFALMGIDLLERPVGGVSNGPVGLSEIRIDRESLHSSPSTSGRLNVNLPSTTVAVAAADLPSANAAGARFSAKTSMAVYDDLGKERVLDVYFTKTGSEQWEVAVFDRAMAGPSGGFPYSSGPLATSALAFDAMTGRLATATASISVPVPGGRDFEIDLSPTTQFAAPFQVLEVRSNGSAPSALDHIEISSDGILSAVFKNGARQDRFRIPLGSVSSPDNLKVIRGNVFGETDRSGVIRVANANSAGLGSVLSGTLEESTVDLASELTNMIEAQRAFAANSKSFQAGSDMLEILMNLRS